MIPPLRTRLLAEFIGSALLVAVIVGSGIAATRLSADAGLQLLVNSVVTALGLGVLILLLGPVSGAHFNPVVTIADWWLGRGSRRTAELGAYIAIQLAGASAGAVLANAMFDLAPLQIATTHRAGLGVLIGEIVATAGLVMVIAGLVRSGRTAHLALAAGAYIGAAYWFVSSTSFANPAVTVGRMFSDTFAGIAPDSAPGFVAAQLVGAAIGLLLAVALFPAVARAPAGTARSTPRQRSSA